MDLRNASASEDHNVFPRFVWDATLVDDFKSLNFCRGDMAFHRIIRKAKLTLQWGRDWDWDWDWDWYWKPCALQKVCTLHWRTILTEGDIASITTLLATIDIYGILISVKKFAVQFPKQILHMTEIHSLQPSYTSKCIEIWKWHHGFKMPIFFGPVWFPTCGPNSSMLAFLFVGGFPERKWKTKELCLFMGRRKAWCRTELRVEYQKCRREECTML